MINFSVSSTLKSWSDYIARAGRTFRYSEAGPQSLVTGKRVIVDYRSFQGA
jgi:FMN-dependent NADH-azoreductase